MGRQLTFRQLGTIKGWPHSRQWTDKLVKAKKVPPPKKRPGGGAINVWDETEWDIYQGTFVSAFAPPAFLALTAALIDALSTTSIDGILNAIERLRAILEQEGAAASDVVVTLKASLSVEAGDERSRRHHRHRHELREFRLPLPLLFGSESPCDASCQTLVKRERQANVI